MNILFPKNFKKDLLTVLIKLCFCTAKKKKNQHIEKASYEMGENIWTSSLW